MDAAPLDPAKTAPFQLGDPGGEPCLLLHGFTGSPWELLPLGETLAQAGYFVRGIRLPGHGTTPEAMLGVEAEDWFGAVETALLGLGPGPVRVAGLSMGALLGVWLAARHPERVRALALMAPAVAFQDPMMARARLLRGLPLMEILKPWITKEGTDLEDPVARANAPVLRAFPSTRLRDLWKVQDASRAAWPRVRAPTLIAVARHDHVVEGRGARELARGLVHATVRLVEINEGFHIMPRDRGSAVLASEVVDFFHRL